VCPQDVPFTAPEPAPVPAPVATAAIRPLSLVAGR
jgi:hypothetical protein